MISSAIQSAIELTIGEALRGAPDWVSSGSLPPSPSQASDQGLAQIQIVLSRHLGSA